MTSQPPGDDSPHIHSPGEDPAAPAADPAPRVPWPWTEALLVLGLVFLAGIFVEPLVSAANLGAFALPVLTLVGGLLMGGFTLLVARTRHGSSMWLLWGHRRPKGADVLIGLGAAVVGLIGVWVIVAALTTAGRAPAVQTELREAVANPSTLPLTALVAVLLVPVAEELLYRGMFFQGLRDRLGRWPAIGLSGFVFGLFHVQWNSLAGTLLLLAAFYPFGMWLAWLFDRRRTLLVPIVCHAAYNGMNLLVYVNSR